MSFFKNIVCRYASPEAITGYVKNLALSGKKLVEGIAKGVQQTATQMGNYASLSGIKKSIDDHMASCAQFNEIERAYETLGTEFHHEKILSTVVEVDGIPFQISLNADQEGNRKISLSLVQHPDDGDDLSNNAPVRIECEDKKEFMKLFRNPSELKNTLELMASIDPSNLKEEDREKIQQLSDTAYDHKTPAALKKGILNKICELYPAIANRAMGSTYGIPQSMVNKLQYPGSYTVSFPESEERLKLLAKDCNTNAKTKEFIFENPPEIKQEGTWQYVDAPYVEGSSGENGNSNVLIARNTNTNPDISELSMEQLIETSKDVISEFDIASVAMDILQEIKQGSGTTEEYLKEIEAALPEIQQDVQSLKGDQVNENFQKYTQKVNQGKPWSKAEATGIYKHLQKVKGDPRTVEKYLHGIQKHLQNPEEMQEDIQKIGDQLQKITDTKNERQATIKQCKKELDIIGKFQVPTSGDPVKQAFEAASIGGMQTVSRAVMAFGTLENVLPKCEAAFQATQAKLESNKTIPNPTQNASSTIAAQ